MLFRSFDLHACAQALSTIDVLVSLAILASEKGYVCPVFHPGYNVNVVEGKHPILDDRMKKKRYVSNDWKMSEDEHVQLITGPNMGGKSTFMRQTALISLLAYCGSFVPAKSAKLGSIDRIFTRIGSADDLSTGKSTFMVEMTETSQILHHATSQSLVLMDEVGRGTSTYDGLSLAWACVLDLTKRVKCLCLFATHYFELTELGGEAGIDNYHVTAQELNGNLILLHKVQHGPASQSHGLQVAKLAGIPANVIKEAQKRLKILEKQQHQHLQNTVQTDLFSAIDNKIETHFVERIIEVQAHSPALELLQNIDVDELTPRQALEQLYQLKALSKTAPTVER